MVTIEHSDINEEYVLLIGGKDENFVTLESVFKFNDTWFSFGKLIKPRSSSNSIYWNGAVYVIGGFYSFAMEKYHNTGTKSSRTTKMEIWKIEDSPDKFKTKENWPELIGWSQPHLFIVSDSFFPDY